jgi:predicted metal-dependent phosphoesterase TrpH
MLQEIRLEFHSHTGASKDSLTKPEELVKACRAKGIDRIVVTDHNTIAGALRAKALAPDLVIIGEEIMTLQGELLTAFVSVEIPSGLDALAAIERLRDQGAFISVSHPFDELRNGHWELEDLERVAPLVDAIEIFNARVIRPEHNTRASAYASERKLSGTVGSDAHTTRELGRAVQILPPFADAEELRLALKDARYETRLSSPMIHFASRYAVWRKKLAGEGGAS